MTQGHLAEVVGVKTNTISNYENGKSEPEFGLLERIVKFLDVDAHDFLYTDLTQTIFQTKCVENGIKANDTANDTKIDTFPNVHKSVSIENVNFQTKCVENVLKKNEDNFEDKNEDKRNVYKSSSNFQTKCVENATLAKGGIKGGENGGTRNVYKTPPFDEVNIDDTIAIPITDVSAAAGGGAFNADHHETNGAIQLPRSMLKRGTHLCVSVDGRSMEPTLQNGSMVVIRHLDRNEWAYLKDSSLYVITDREGSTYIKRITNNLHANGTLILRSDNSDKRRFSNITLDEEELFNIWAVEWCLSSIFPEAYAEVNERLDLMEGDMSEIKTLVRTIARETIKKP